MEEWKTIPNFPLHECSNKGRIRRKNNQTILSCTVDRRGYVMVNISENKRRRNFQVHRLVANLFIENPQNKPYVNHIDGNKTNNNISNLEWCTPMENTTHAIKVLHKNPGGKNKKSIVCLENNFIFESSRLAEAMLLVHNSHVNLCCHGKRKSTGGYHFEFLDGGIV